MVGNTFVTPLVFRMFTGGTIAYHQVICLGSLLPAYAIKKTKQKVSSKGIDKLKQIYMVYIFIFK